MAAALALALGLCWGLSGASPAQAAPRFTADEVHDFYAYDQTRPLNPTLTLEADFPTYQRFLLTFEVEGEKVYAAYFRPKRTGPVPGLVGIHGIWSPRREQFWPLAEAAVKRGYAVILPSLPYHHQRRTPFSLVSGQQFLTRDVTRTRANFRRAVVEARRSLDWLLAQPDVDPQRVGLVGVSLGGVIAGVTLKVEPRFSAAVLAVAAGDLAENLLYSQIRVVQLLRFWLGIGALKLDQASAGWAIADPGQLPGAEEVPVLMLNATDDQIFKVSTVEELRQTLPRADIIWSTSRHRYPEKAAQLQMLEYFGRQFGWPAELESPRFHVVEEPPAYPRPGDRTLPYAAVLTGATGEKSRVELEVALIDRFQGPVVLLDEKTPPETRAVLQNSGVTLAYLPGAEDPERRSAAAEYLAETSYANVDRLFYARPNPDGWDVFPLRRDGSLWGPAEQAEDPQRKPVRIRELLSYLVALEDAVPASLCFAAAVLAP